jgi:hypothetical protein
MENLKTLALKSEGSGTRKNLLHTEPFMLSPKN